MCGVHFGRYQPAWRRPATSRAIIARKPGHHSAPRPAPNHQATIGWPSNTRGRLIAHCSAIPASDSTANIRVWSGGITTMPGGR
jgi:hypothetical protein